MIPIECFLYYSEIKIANSNIFKVKIENKSYMFFMQDGKYLSYKVYKYNKSDYIKYNIKSIKDFKNSSNLLFLNDGNDLTYILSDIYSDDTPEIIIDLGKIIYSNAFNYKLLFDSRNNVNISYYILNDNINFVKVEDINNHDFRYLKIVFDNTYNNNTKSNFNLSELTFIKNNDSIYVVKPINDSVVFVYSDYKCHGEELLINTIRNLFSLSNKTIFSTNAQTQTYNAKFKINDDYNSDFDRDGVRNELDNCLFVSNKDQKDIDCDLIGGACDIDKENKNKFNINTDGDGIGDDIDNCPMVYNIDQYDRNTDGIGDLCTDDDNDGILGYMDNCIWISNSDQDDINNNNNIGDACEFDKDGDDIYDSIDNCINIINPDQLNTDKDSIGNVCNNCVNIKNKDQLDKNNNHVGDMCEDTDNDGIGDVYDDYDNRFIESNKHFFLYLLFL